jgi:Bacterial Ig-like domain (group 3)/Pentapeptide repeats (8 copies)
MSHSTHPLVRLVHRSMRCARVRTAGVSPAPGPVTGRQRHRQRRRVHRPGGTAPGLIRRTAGMIWAVAGVGVLVAAMVAGPAGSAAAASMTPSEAVVPANAALNPDVVFWSLSCASAGNCTAVGDYTDSSGNQQGLLLSQAAGTWATGVEAPLPANAGGRPGGVTVYGVSCASAGNCTAVGYYSDSSGDRQGLLLTQTAGTWAAGVEAPLPASASADPFVNVLSVSCALAGNCTAVGAYTDSSGNQQGVLLTQTSGTWAAGVEAPLPANAGSSQQFSTEFGSVSCASPGNCTAVGSYTDSSGYAQGLLLTQTSGTWATGIEAPLPANAVPAPSFAAEAYLGEVSCVSAGNCTAVGNYYDAPGFYQIQGLLLTQTSGTWAAGTETSLPADAATYTGVSLAAVSCASAGNCTAVGSYDNSSGTEALRDTSGLLLTQTSGTWAPVVEASLPPDAAANGEAGFASVSCASAGNCTASGDYGDRSGYAQGMLATETSGTWAAAIGLALPANAAPGQQSDLGPVSCASAGNCTAVGYYTDTSGYQQGVLVTTTAPAQQPTSTTLVSSANPSAAGQAVTYTVTVSPAPGGGAVAFTDDGAAISGCGAQPVSAAGQATCQTAPGTAGAHNIAAAFSGSSDSAASTSATMTQVVTKTACQSLAGCNLSGLNLAGAQLPGANLSGANLNGTDLSGADLSGANLSGANLNKADLSGADLAGADLAGANLNGADLTGADLSGADVAGANLNKVTWSGTTCPDGTNSNTDGGTCTGHL